MRDANAVFLGRFLFHCFPQLQLHCSVAVTSIGRAIDDRVRSLVLPRPSVLTLICEGYSPVPAKAVRRSFRTHHDTFISHISSLSQIVVDGRIGKKSIALVLTGTDVCETAAFYNVRYENFPRSHLTKSGWKSIGDSKCR
jgi:hypothetical protein